MTFPAVISNGTSHPAVDSVLDGAEYIPKNILVTGGAGFIASHAVIHLVKKYPQYKIVNFDKLDYCACLENLDEISRYRNYKFVKGNICSSDLVTYVLREEEIDTIMHFAAQTHVDNSFGNSFTFTHNNIMGTHVLLESAKELGTIKRFIHVSTDEVYGEGEHDQEPMFEDHTLEPTNPYAATKAGAEFIAKAYYRSFKLPIIITRGNNVYGPHQYPEKMIPKFINQLMRRRPLTVHGDGNNTRNFLYVEDVARAFDCVLHKATVGKVYNIGGTNEYSVLKVAQDLLRIMGIDEESVTAKRTTAEESDHDAIVPETPSAKASKAGTKQSLNFVEDRAFNDLRYTVNSDRLKGLGWKEEVSWDEGLRTTIEWYKKHSSRFGNIEQALMAHPKASAGLDVSDVAAENFSN